MAQFCAPSDAEIRGPIDPHASLLIRPSRYTPSTDTTWCPGTKSEANRVVNWASPEHATATTASARTSGVRTHERYEPTIRLLPAPLAPHVDAPTHLPVGRSRECPKQQEHARRSDHG